jgi:hypothetical protein
MQRALSDQNLCLFGFRQNNHRREALPFSGSIGNSTRSYVLSIICFAHGEALSFKKLALKFLLFSLISAH